MKPEIRLVYQDCVTCKWGLSLEEIQKCADKLGLGKVKQFPFWAEGAAAIIKDADKKGITVPFFECNGKYAESLETLKRKLDKPARKQKGKTNGDSSKA